MIPTTRRSVLFMLYYWNFIGRKLLLRTYLNTTKFDYQQEKQSVIALSVINNNKYLLSMIIIVIDSIPGGNTTIANGSFVYR